MNDDTTALIAAAGVGSRLGLGPKAFLALDGQTLLRRVVDTAGKAAAGIRAAVPSDMLAQAAAEAGPDVVLTEGGATRQDTFRRLLEPVETPLVLLLDVSRPFVSVDLCARVLDAARRHGAAGAFMPATVPCAAVAADGRVLRATAAADYHLPQMPQAFRTTVLRDVLAAAARDRVARQTIWQLVVEAGVPFMAVAGEPGNIKITDAWDWRFAQLLHTSFRSDP